jgi:cytochrome b561
MTARLHYGAAAKLLHWVTAGLLAVQLPLGWLMPDIRRNMTPGTAMALHVSLGITILLLMTLRLVWRLVRPVAPEPGLPRWQRLGSGLVHRLLYAAVLLTTVSGWFYASFRGWSILIYAVAPMPHLAAQGSALGRSIGNLHSALGWILLGLIGIHIAAALVHLLIYRDRVMQRMLPAGWTSPA